MENQTPAPTTYIQADATTFKDLVQKLTGGSVHKLRPKAAVFKLQERRKHSVRDLEIIKRGVALSAAKCSPVEGPGTPFRRETAAVGTDSPAEEVERAIAENGFYLHNSPARKAEPPVLLTLFPLTSPNH